MTIGSEFLELAGKKIRFRSVMYNGETGEKAAKMEQLAVCLDTTLRKARNSPEDIIGRAREYLGMNAG